MGIATVAVFSDPDAGLPFVTAADEAVRLPGATPAETYLRGDAIIAAAAATGADAVHPGYGFLSENAGFARACAAAGLTFVGPPPETIEAMGSKIAAKELMAEAGVPVLPGAVFDDAAEPGPGGSCAGPRPRSAIPCWSRRRSAAAGGACGSPPAPASWPRRWPRPAGRRRRRSATARCSSSGTSSAPRHIEVQIFGDRTAPWSTCSSGSARSSAATRRSSRRRPSPASDDALRAELCAAAVAAGQAIGYVGAGTVEFVLDADGRFYFLEVNTRLQVEHPVTELITGLDLVRLQLEVAGGRPLPPRHRGAARRARDRGPAVRRGPGRRVPAGQRRAAPFEIGPAPGVRVDAGLRLRHDGQHVLRLDAGQGHRLRPDPGRRAAACWPAPWPGARLHGVVTNRDLLVGILREPEFLAGADRHRLPRPARRRASWPGGPGRPARAPARGGAGRPGRAPG